MTTTSLPCTGQTPFSSHSSRLIALHGFPETEGSGSPVTWWFVVYKTCSIKHQESGCPTSGEWGEGEPPQGRNWPPKSTSFLQVLRGGVWPAVQRSWRVSRMTLRMARILHLSKPLLSRLSIASVLTNVIVAMAWKIYRWVEGGVWGWRMIVLEGGGEVHQAATQAGE